jgi:hypothetical protein
MRVYIFLLFPFFLSSCSNRHIIPEAKMKVVLWEISCIDELLVFKYSKTPDTTKTLSAERDSLYQKVFLLNQTNAKAFFDSYRFYQKNPLKFKQLTDSSLAYGLRQRSNAIVNVKETQPVKNNEGVKDSIKRVILKKNKALQ